MEKYTSYSISLLFLLVCFTNTMNAMNAMDVMDSMESMLRKKDKIVKKVNTIEKRLIDLKVARTHALIQHKLHPEKVSSNTRSQESFDSEKERLEIDRFLQENKLREIFCAVRLQYDMLSNLNDARKNNQADKLDK